jgi:hypothetical protein
MLNELYDAASTFADNGISPKSWHKEYRPVRKPTLAFWVFLDQFGSIADIERVTDPTEVAGLHTWESKGDLRQSFPYFNIPPLFWIHFHPKTDEDDKAFEKALKANKLTGGQIQGFLEKIENAESTKRWNTKAYNKLRSCLEKGKALKSILGQAPEESRSVLALIDRLTDVTAQDFYDRLRNAFANKLLSHSETAGKYFEALFYRGEKEPGNVVTLLLELTDGVSHFGFPVKHHNVRDWINERLLSRSPVQEGSPSIPDIFGNDPAGWEQTFDDVHMRNALGNVKLRAMAAAAVCQYRYGKAEADSCPVGQESRSMMKGALEWLTAPERESKTWTTISRAADNKEILLAYPSELPPEPPDTAMFFGGSAEVDTDNTGRFENCARNVIGTLRGLMAKNPNLDIRVFLLRKMDTARTRVSSHKRCSAQHFMQAAERWQVGNQNLPHVLIKQFTKDKDTTAAWREPETPFPMETVWALNTLWSRNGATVSRVKGITADDGIALLLEDGAFLRPVLDRMMYAATRNLLSLVLALGQAHAQGQVFSTQKNYARQTLIMPSVLGLLLYKLNITKEHYMKSPPYLVGRLLSLADQLHYQYCQHVRDGSVPSQLMGNALMATASEEPVKALALYCNRILPYQAWARTVSGDAAGLARYFLSELGKVSAELGDVCSDGKSKTIPERCTDADKAQMLIGYLARPEKSDSETSQ